MPLQAGVPHQHPSGQLLPLPTPPLLALLLAPLLLLPACPKHQAAHLPPH
jgi:hypothetical protein